MDDSADTPSRTDCPIEHPGRNLQPPIRCRTREAAAENLLASPLDHFMDVGLATRPWMPRIKKLTFLDPVGVPLSCCTTP
jgi:hypothetical protein